MTTQKAALTPTNRLAPMRTLLGIKPAALTQKWASALTNLNQDTLAGDNPWTPLLAAMPDATPDITWPVAYWCWQASLAAADCHPALDDSLEALRGPVLQQLANTEAS
ncbi:MAG TPA: hypothetical protein VIC08_14995, partial [Cellvibrionaceae bacterium]